MTPRRSWLDWVLEAASLIALVATAKDIATHWSTLPAQIPVHFGADGNPNGWGSRNNLLVLLGTTVLMAILLTIAETYQRLINIPIDVNRGSPEVRRLLRSLVIVIKAVIVTSFFWITNATIQGTPLGPAFLPIFLGALALPILYYIIKLKRL